jgi:hypothetical protein
LEAGKAVYMVILLHSFNVDMTLWWHITLAAASFAMAQWALKKNVVY